LRGFAYIVELLKTSVSDPFLRQLEESRRLQQVTSAVREEGFRLERIHVARSYSTASVPAVTPCANVV
jgi:hypothetical protein